MGTILEFLFGLIYGPAILFVGHPFSAYAVAAIFIVLSGRTLIHRRRHYGRYAFLILIPAPCWILFGWFEHRATVEKANIRIDLLVTWPAILFISTTCVLASIWGSLKQ